MHKRQICTPSVLDALKEEHTAVRKRGREGASAAISNFSCRIKFSGGIGWDSLVELVCPVISEKTATDIINFFSQENSEKVALWSDFGCVLVPQEP